MKTTQSVQQAKPVAAADPTTMRAITQSRYGTVPEDVLRLGQVARPGIGDDEVLIQVRAAGVDPARPTSTRCASSRKAARSSRSSAGPTR